MPPRRLAAGARKRLEQMRRQALVQRPAAGRIDVDAVALNAIRARAVALVDCDADARLLKALRQSEAADAAADHDDMQAAMLRAAKENLLLG